MFAWKIFWRLLIRSFSMDPASLRFPGGKRIVAVLLIWSFLIVHLAGTWCCLWLDRLFFPDFRKIEVRRSLFIVGLPRSGTSFLLEALGGDADSFTGFRLWELVFAPSILQKKFWLSLRAFDRRTGNRAYRLAGWLDEKLFRRMKGIHDLNWAVHEEDEFLFMYLFRSIYLIYMFPGLERWHRLLEVDGPDRLASLRFYRACVQRHLYVFDPAGEKVFLSKNPAYLTKLEALTNTFPAGTFIHLSRPLEEVAPSTFSLNNYLLSFFTDPDGKNSPRIETLAVLLRWQQHLEKYLSDEIKSEKWIRVSFENLVRQPSGELERIYRFTSLPVSAEAWDRWFKLDRRSSHYQSTHRYPELTMREKRMISKRTLENR